MVCVCVIDLKINLISFVGEIVLSASIALKSEEKCVMDEQL